MCWPCLFNLQGCVLELNFQAIGGNSMRMLFWWFSSSQERGVAGWSGKLASQGWGGIWISGTCTFAQRPPPNPPAFRSPDSPDKDIKSGGLNPPWGSPCADRHPVPHADFVLAEVACSHPSGFADHYITNAWIGAVAQWQHQMRLRKKGAEASAPWLIGLKHLPGSAAVVWPVVEKITPSGGGDNAQGTGARYYVPEISLSEPLVVAICSFDEWEVCKFVAHSPAYQWTEFAEAREATQLQAVRFYRVGEPKDLMLVAAGEGFWNLPVQFMQSVARLRSEALLEGLTLVETTFELSKRILVCSDQQACACMEKRVVHLCRSVESHDGNFGDCEELDEVLEKTDEKAAHQQSEEYGNAQEALSSARVALSKKVASLHKRSGASAKKNALYSGGRKCPRSVPPGTIDHSTGKSMPPPPPGAYVWRALSDGRWCGELSPYPEISRSWARRTERGAMIAMLQELWRQFLAPRGMAEEDCPIQGLFRK